MVLHDIAWYATLHGIALYCVDLAVVAQKVKVFNEDRCDLKKWINNRSMWLLEVLTELKILLVAFIFNL